MTMPHVTGKWQPVDDSKNHLELAETDTEAPSGERVIAIRGSFQPESPPIFATPQQMRNLVTSYEDGRLNRLLGGR